MAAWAAILALTGFLASADRGIAAPARSELSVGQMQNFTFFDSPKQMNGISFVDAQGRKLGLEDFRGKFVLVNLWATWCGPCRREMPSLDRLQARLSGDEFTVLALSQDRKGVAAVEKFLTQVGIKNLGVFVDSSARSARTLGAIGLPTTILLNKEGGVIGRLIGPAEWDSDEAVRLIEIIIQEAGHQSAEAQR
jgi:thiol-disulfide isomerase/thioredoxin